MDHARQVTAIVENHVKWLIAGECAESLLDAPIVLLLGLSLPSIDWHASRSNAVARIKQNRLQSHLLETNAAAAWS